MHCPNDDTFTELDLDRIIEALEHHRRDINGALAAFQRIREWMKPRKVAGSTTVASHGGTFHPAEFSANQPLAANVYAILRHAGRPMHSSDLQSVLKECGVTSKSADFENTLNSILSKKDGLFKRVAPKTWALVEWAGNAPNPTPAPAADNIVPLRGAPGSVIAAALGLLQ